jgi:bacterioferritin (cytochrome b1)
MEISDVEYDLLTTLQSKLEALDVYEAYIEDCDEAGEQGLRQLFEEIQRDDERHAMRLREELGRLITRASGGSS